MKETICGIIYKATNLVNGKGYVGKTYDTLKVRKREHEWTAESGSQYVFHRAIRKYGKDNFNWIILKKYCSPTELNEAEMSCIKEQDTFGPNGYNLTTGGEGGKLAEETKRKISEGRRGEKHWMFGKHLSEETKRKQSKALKGKYKGRESWNFGKCHSIETKRKMSEAKKGKNIGRNNHMFGKHLSEKHKKQLSEAIRGEKHYSFGKHVSEEHKRKISETMKGKYVGKNSYWFGKHHSIETKRKMSRLKKKYWKDEKTLRKT